MSNIGIEEQLQRLSLPDVVDRIDAIKTLGASGNPEAIQPLVDCLGDTNWGVRRIAAYEVSRFGKPAIDPLLALLEQENWSIVRFAAQALGLIRERQAAPFLLAAYQREYMHIPGYASKAIENAIRYIGDPDTLVKWIEGLAHEEWEKRPLVDTDVMALSTTQDEHSAVALAEALVDEPSADFTRPLVKIGKPAVPVLAHILAHYSTSEACSAAIEVLTEIGTPEALQVVEEWEANQRG